MEKQIPKWKRIFDIIFSLIAIIIFLPFMLTIALIIKIFDKGDVIYTQKRIGYKGKEFRILKFRTMYVDADKKLKEILEKDSQAKIEWEKSYKLRKDPRITPIGKILRKTSLDELPQFFNVLKGDMSIVGPRPVTKEELEKYYKDKSELYKSVKPGITGYWQVEGRSDVKSYEERVNMDVWYIKKQSFLLDIKIILKTILTVLKMKGSY